MKIPGMSHLGRKLFSIKSKSLEKEIFGNGNVLSRSEIAEKLVAYVKDEVKKADLNLWRIVDGS